MASAGTWEKSLVRRWPPEAALTERSPKRATRSAATPSAERVARSAAARAWTYSSTSFLHFSATTPRDAHTSSPTSLVHTP